MKANRVTAFLTTQVIGAIFVFALFGENLSANFWFIDDHAILDAIRKVNSGGSVFSLLLDSEVGAWGRALRYRPSYYFLHSSEAYIWGDATSKWYLVRLLTFQQLVALTLFFLCTRFGIVLGVAGSIWIFSREMWTDIFSRLGTGEYYIALGLVIGGFGWLMLSGTNRLTQKLGQGLLFLGAVVAAGSKENVAVMIFGALIYLVFSSKYRSKVNWIFGSILMAFCLLILTEIVIAVSKTGTDIYGTSVRVSDRLAIFSKFSDTSAMMISSLGILLVSWVERRNLRERIVSPEWRMASVAFGVMLVNFVFYNGDWPAGNRYDFPGILVVPLVVASVLGALNNSFGFCQRNSRRMAAGVLVVVLLFALPGFSKLKAGAHNNVVRTARTKATIDTVRRIAGVKTDFPVVLEMSSPSRSYELLYSLRAFLRHSGVTNEVKLRIHYDKNDFVPNSLDFILASQLEREEMVSSELRHCISVIDPNVSPSGSLCEEVVSASP